ncbi:MAG TPA: hypothetical protein VFZ09_49045 [Archangium sp.]|uniref:hypothetical protein n=1 Tax=Archangium sp. TaxID=1872627 RepID=UPI002E3064EE|nr:hypothetical protein [Archangium sp.]HEX5754227.1 hypothetical protein [Archangium sp.]
MDAIDILVNEHRHIERVMDVLERAAHFLVTFVDGSHDAKEDEVFQAITSRGWPQPWVGR